MRNCLLIWLILAGAGFDSTAVNNLRITDNRSRGTGGNEVTQSVLFNPSLLTSYSSSIIAFDYYNGYSIKELSNYSFYGAFPNAVLPAGIHISSFGYDEYRETMFRGILAKQLTTKVGLGISFQYLFLQSEVTDLSAHYVSTDLGIVYRPVEDLLIGMLIMNFPSFSLKNKRSDTKFFRSGEIQIGFQWQFINNLFIMTTGEVHLYDHSITGSLGIEYFLLDNFKLRTGVKTHPSQLFMGIGYTLSSFTVDTAVSFHPMLGISTGIGLTFSF